jgi:ABC-type Zn uptake system ZnuABC Zn-binding protein ZnuA
VVIEAAAGLTSRQLHEGEIADPDHVGDPHFWLDPNKVIKYVENIRAGLSQVDPAGAATYRVNAEAYSAKLKELDRWIADRVKEVPEANRKLVTNHESFVTLPIAMVSDYRQYPASAPDRHLRPNSWRS